MCVRTLKNYDLYISIKKFEKEMKLISISQIQ